MLSPYINATDVPSEEGFSIVEAMIATTVLMVVCATVMQGVLGLTDVSRLVTNRTDMHNGVRNATELLTQEVGQAGRISLPGPVSLAAAGVEGDGTITVTSTAGMFVGEKLQIGSDNEQETVTIGAINGAAITLAAAIPAGLRFAHAAATPVTAPGGFAAGVVPTGTPNGSTPNRLKIFGDVHDDGNMVYVEVLVRHRQRPAVSQLDADLPPPANKPVPGVEQILIDNIEANPDGTPCFTYQTKTVTGTTFVVDVAITLTVRTQQRDKNTNDFQRETKALLNVSPRNVFNTWQMASLDIDNRVQPTPGSVTGLSGSRGSGCRGLPVTSGDVMTRSDERGIALVVALFMVLILSVLGSSLVFVSRTETLSSLNYKTMSQTRYGAESGVHRAANHLLWAYVPPANPAEMALFDVTTSPVRVVANGLPVVLSTHPGFASNYPGASAARRLRRRGAGKPGRQHRHRRLQLARNPARHANDS